jgi:hypothetical protein
VTNSMTIMEQCDPVMSPDILRSRSLQETGQAEGLLVSSMACAESSSWSRVSWQGALTGLSSRCASQHCCAATKARMMHIISEKPLAEYAVCGDTAP